MHQEHQKFFMSHPRFEFLCQTQSFLLNDWVLINVANKKETGYGFLIPNLFPFCMIPYSYKHVKKWDSVSHPIS